MFASVLWTLTWVSSSASILSQLVACLLSPVANVIPSPPRAPSSLEAYFCCVARSPRRRSPPSRSPAGPPLECSSRACCPPNAAPCPSKRTSHHTPPQHDRRAASGSSPCSPSQNTRQPLPGSVQSNSTSQPAERSPAAARLTPQANLSRES